MNKEEFQTKLKRVKTYCKEKNIDGIILSRVDNFAWISTGHNNYVATSAEIGEASFLVTKRKNYVISNNIEGPRLALEEFTNNNVELLEYPWPENQLKLKRLKELTKGKTILSDTPLKGFKSLPCDFDTLKYSLTPQEVERFKKLGKDCANVLEGVCKRIRKGQTELEIAGRIADESWGKNIVPIVILIAVDDRADKFRHPLPTAKKVNKTAMVVMCGRRNGLIVSLTRMVSLGNPDQKLIEKHYAVCSIDACFMINTKPGEKIGTIFQKAIKHYDYFDFPLEWELHHQGGPTGYSTRYFIATPNDKNVVVPYEAFAWNPSITGTKSEDTIILTDDGFTIITETNTWPKLKVEYDGIVVSRPDILVIK